MCVCALGEGHGSLAGVAWAADMRATARLKGNQIQTGKFAFYVFACVCARMVFMYVSLTVCCTHGFVCRQIRRILPAEATRARAHRVVENCTHGYAYEMLIFSLSMRAC